MSEALLNQHTVIQVLGQTRLRRLISAGWIAPIERTRSRVLYRVSDIHAALRRLERERVPPDKLEVLRVRESEARNGYPRVRKEEKVMPPVLDLSEIKFDFSDLNL